MGNHLVVGAIDRAGLIAHVGSTPLSSEQQQRLRKMDDMEMKFEFVRRNFAQEAASRYGCLWLAEDSQNGRRHLETMLPNAKISRVTISDFYRLTKCDSSYVDAYWNNQNILTAKYYWQGVCANVETPTWEFLLDGQIKFEISDIDELCLTAMSLAAWPKQLPVPERVKGAAQRALNL